MNRNTFTKPIDAVIEQFYAEPSPRDSLRKLEDVVAERIQDDDFADVVNRLREDFEGLEAKAKKQKNDKRLALLRDHHAKLKTRLDEFLRDVSISAKSHRFVLSGSGYEFFAARYKMGLYAAITKHVLYKYLDEGLKKAIEEVRLDASTDPFYPFEAHLVDKTPAANKYRGRKPKSTRVKGDAAHKERMKIEYALAEDADMRRDRRVRHRRFDDLIKIASYLYLASKVSPQVTPPTYRTFRGGLDYEVDENHRHRSREHFVIMCDELDAWNGGILAERALRFEELAPTVREYMTQEKGPDAPKKRYLAIKTTHRSVSVSAGEQRGIRSLIKIEVPCAKGGSSNLMNLFTLAGVFVDGCVTTTALFHPSMLSDYVVPGDCTVATMNEQRPENDEEIGVEDALYEAGRCLMTCGNLIGEYAWKPIDVCAKSVQ